MDTSRILLIGSVLLLASMLAGKISSRFGVPTLIFFLIVGVLAGSEGIGGIEFDNPHVTEFIGVVALNFILFSGGMDTHWKGIKPILSKGLLLSTVGVFITAISVGAFVSWFLNFSFFEGILLGAIVSATDAAAVFSILRNKGIRLKGSTAELLEFESGSNDPMAYFLTVSLTSVVAQGSLDGWALLVLFLKEFILGGAMGIAMGKINVWVINRIKLESEGLYPVLLLGLVIFTYSVTHFIGGNGFLAVYLSALILGNSSFIHKRSLLRFYEGQAWLMQIVLFLTLGLLVFPSKVWPVIDTGLLIAAFLIFIARPLGVFISLAFSKFDWRMKAFISWVGLRGAVPIVFATYPLIAGLDKAFTIFNLVFFISVSSVLVQGTTLAAAAKFFGVIVSGKDDDANNLPGIVQVALSNDSIHIRRKILELHLPPEIQIIAIQRDGAHFQPVGSTRLEPGDHLSILAKDSDDLAKFRAELNASS